MVVALYYRVIMECEVIIVFAQVFSLLADPRIALLALLVFFRTLAAPFLVRFLATEDTPTISRELLSIALTVLLNLLACHFWLHLSTQVTLLSVGFALVGGIAVAPSILLRHDPTLFRYVVYVVGGTVFGGLAGGLVGYASNQLSFHTATMIINVLPPMLHILILPVLIGSLILFAAIFEGQSNPAKFAMWGLLVGFGMIPFFRLIGISHTNAIHINALYFSVCLGLWMGMWEVIGSILSKDARHLLIATLFAALSGIFMLFFLLAFCLPLTALLQLLLTIISTAVGNDAPTLIFFIAAWLGCMIFMGLKADGTLPPAARKMWFTLWIGGGIGTIFGVFIGGLGGSFPNAPWITQTGVVIGTFVAGTTCGLVGFKLAHRQQALIG